MTLFNLDKRFCAAKCLTAFRWFYYLSLCPDIDAWFVHGCGEPMLCDSVGVGGDAGGSWGWWRRRNIIHPIYQLARIDYDAIIIDLVECVLPARPNATMSVLNVVAMRTLCQICSFTIYEKLYTFSYTYISTHKTIVFITKVENLNTRGICGGVK